MRNISSIILALLLALAANSACAQQPPPALIGSWELGSLMITFAPDGNYVWKDNVATLQGSYQVEGNFLRMYYQNKPTPYLYYIEGSSMRLTGPKGEVISLTKTASAPPAGAQQIPQPGTGAQTTDAQLLGAWQGQSLAINVVFNADGSYQFGPDSGLWRQQGNKIQFTSSNGKTSLYQYRFQGANLQLADPNGNILTLVRQGAAQGSGGQSARPAASPALGHWAKGGLALVLNPDKTYTFANTSGVYQDDGSTLTLYFNGQPTVYKYQIQNNTLYLTDASGNTIGLQRQ